MINEEMFCKWSLTREELAEFYKSERERTQFPWLDEMRSLIREKYGARVMTILYRFAFNTHWFRFCVYSYEDMKKLPMDINSPKKPKTNDAEISVLIKENLHPKKYEKTNFSVISFMDFAQVYLFERIWAVRKQIENEFAFLKPYRVSVPARGVTVFIFDTKEEARKFVQNTVLRTEIKKRIFELVKPFDDYGILKDPEKIEIMADYREFYEAISAHYHEWIEDINPAQYEKSLFD